ncbi:MAG: gliding motility-associated ABC transporter ATP-binding subunit GldA [Bacteroidetes bacterium]|nr:gliding motility-associated ABC transporter ATP-binding subunit GldA [Bacteroidota bacterium]
MSVVVQQLTKKFGEQKAVDAISFVANRGEVVGFLGPNGAGKTTTMKLITCFLQPTSGKIEVCGYDVEVDEREAQKRIGYLPEHNPLYKDMYVKEYLHFTAGLQKVKNKKDRVKEMIEITGLEREQNKQIGALSKGFRQRVGLAQAMLHDPDVLILDEPTSGLDPNQLIDIRNLIRTLGKEKTVIFSTHIMQEVQAICDRVLIINKGKIVADDPIGNLQQRIKGETIVTVEFLEKVQKKSLLKINNVSKVNVIGENKWQFISDKQYDIRKHIFAFAVENQLTLLEMHKEEYSVEDVFQELTKN